MKSGPVLLISGWAHGEEAFRPVAEAMAGCGPIVSLSLASLGPLMMWRKAFPLMRGTVSSRLDLWGEPACVVGWSTGGVVALETCGPLSGKSGRSGSFERNRAILLGRRIHFGSQAGGIAGNASRTPEKPPGRWSPILFPGRFIL